MIEDCKFEVSSKEFNTFLKAIENVNNNGVKLTVQKNCIEALVLTDDNSSVVLYTKIMLIEDAPDEVVGEYIHVKDFKKFKLMLGMNTDDTFAFRVKRNAVYYSNGKIRSAKFALGDSSYENQTRIDSSFFTKFENIMEMKLQRQELSQIVSLSKFASSSVDKVYFRCDEQGKLVAEINDYDTSNNDCVTVEIGTPDKGAIEGQVIVKVKSVELLTFGGDDIELKCVDIAPPTAPAKREVLIVSYINSNIEVHYLLNSMRS